MLSASDLAQQLSNILSSNSIIAFQTFLSSQQIFMHPDIIKIICDILASSMFTHDQKTIAASAMKFVFIKILNENSQQGLDTCWKQFFVCMVDRDHNDMIEWRYINQTKHALNCLIEQMPQTILEIVLNKFIETTFPGKLMLMIAIKQQTDISPKDQLIFFRQTIEDFITESFNVIHNLHELSNPSEDQVLLEHDIVDTIFEWIDIVNRKENYKIQEEFDFCYIIAKLPVMVDLIKEEFKWVLKVDSQGKVSYRMSENVIELYDQSMVDNAGQKKEVEKLLKLQLNIKAAVIHTLAYLTQSFQIDSDVTQFDTVPVLSLTEVLTPIFISELNTNKDLKHYYINDSQSVSSPFNCLIVSIFTFLGVSSRFIFLLQSFKQAKQQILYGIFFNYMRTTKKEKQYFDEDDEEFVSGAEAFIQKIADQWCETPKEACGKLLKSYIELNNQAQAQYVSFLADALKSNELGEKTQLIIQISSKGFCIPSTDMIFSVLTRIYFFSDKENIDFIQYVYDQFLTPQFIFSFKGLNKCRLIQFLQYCYGQYFKENLQLGSKYILWAGSYQSKSEILTKLVLNLMEEAFSCRIISDVWQYLVQQIQNTKAIEVLRVMKRLLQKHLKQIPSEWLLDLTIKISSKIKKEFLDSKENYSPGQGGYNQLLYKCFHVAQILSQNKVVIERQGRVLEEILTLVDFFSDQKVEKYQFNTEIAHLLNNIIIMQELIPIQFERYTELIGGIVRQNKAYGPLLETYYLILLKGDQTFRSHPSFLHKIQSAIQQQILTTQNRTSSTIIDSIFLLLNVYLAYPDLSKENRDILQVTNQLFEEEKQKQKQDQKLCASILLYWMAGEYAFGDYELGRLAQCKIEIFKDQFGLMFALNLRKLIEKYYQTQSLQILLKLSLRLLDFEHHLKSNQNYRGSQFSNKIFKKYLHLDSFEEISGALEFIKENLPRKEYEKCVQMLKNQIGGDVLSQLLSIRVIDNRKERCIFVVKKS